MNSEPAPHVPGETTDRIWAAEVRGRIVDDTLTNLVLTSPPPGERKRTSRLVAAVALVAVLDVLALGVLAASYTGLLRRSGRGATGRSARTSAGPVLEPVASTQSTADYRVASPTYRITVAARYPCWVEVRAGASVLFAAVMTAGSSRSFSVSSRTNVEMGSGGGSVTVDADGQAQQVAPPSAPYTLTFSGA